MSEEQKQPLEEEIPETQAAQEEAPQADAAGEEGAWDDG